MAPKSLPDLFRPVSQVDPIKGRGHSLYGQSVQRVAKGWLLVGCVNGDWACGQMERGLGREVHEPRAECLGVGSLCIAEFQRE